MSEGKFSIEEMKYILTKHEERARTEESIARCKIDIQYHRLKIEYVPVSGHTDIISFHKKYIDQYGEELDKLFKELYIIDRDIFKFLIKSNLE